MPGRRATQPTILKFDENQCIVAVPVPCRRMRYTVHSIYRWGDKDARILGDELTIEEARALCKVREPAATHTERLLKWIDERIELCELEEHRVGAAGAAHEITEREVLTDVMLILDGREPTNKRRWSP